MSYLLRHAIYLQATTIPSTFLALGAGLSYFGSIESDPTSLIFGVEPIYIYGLATLSCGGGWDLFVSGFHLTFLRTLGLGYLLGMFSMMDVTLPL